MNYPYNKATGAQYSENNSGLLLQAGFELPEWATYRQWIGLGYQVQKGSKGTRLKRVCKKERKDGTIKTYIKTFSVFNIEQTEMIAEFN